MPVFFSGRLFDYLKIDSYKRGTVQSRVEYLCLRKEDIKALTSTKTIREGVFMDMPYAMFIFKFGFLLCVFDYCGKCYRAYFFSNIEAN